MLHQPIGVGKSCPCCLRPGANYDEGITLSEEIGKLVANSSAGPVDATIQFEASICRASGHRRETRSAIRDRVLASPERARSR